VQCDGYSAYKKLAAEAPGEAVTLAFCWSHLRRRFDDLAVTPIIHPVEARVSGRDWLTCVGGATGDRRSWSGLRSRSPVAVRVFAKAVGVR